MVMIERYFTDAVQIQHIFVAQALAALQLKNPLHMHWMGLISFYCPQTKQLREMVEPGFEPGAAG